MPVRLLFIAMLFCISSVAIAQSPSKKEAVKWFNSKQWLGKLKLKPHKTINVLEFYIQYHANKANWDRAFAFLEEHRQGKVEKGKYTLVGDDVFATVTENPSKNVDSTQWESHRKYIDIQSVLEGKELIGVNPVAKAVITNPYNEQKDVANYSVKGKLYPATPGIFFIFFPGDAHRPSITPGGNKLVKKVVIKVRAR